MDVSLRSGNEDFPLELRHIWIFSNRIRELGFEDFQIKKNKKNCQLIKIFTDVCISFITALIQVLSIQVRLATEAGVFLGSANL